MLQVFTRLMTDGPLAQLARDVITALAASNHRLARRYIEEDGRFRVGLVALSHLACKQRLNRFNPANAIYGLGLFLKRISYTRPAGILQKARADFIDHYIWSISIRGAHIHWLRVVNFAAEDRLTIACVQLLAIVYVKGRALAGRHVGGATIVITAAWRRTHFRSRHQLGQVHDALLG